MSERLLDGHNDTATDYPRDSRVEQLFAEQAEAAPGHPAVVHGTTTLTYAELHRRSTLLAQTLRRDGLRPAEPVALLLPRTPELIVAALAVLKAGGFYLPVDPAYPAERISQLIEDSGAGLLLTTQELARGHAIAVDAQDWSAEPEADVPAPGDASDVAYLMYTSGTTGRPKGVMIPHRGIVRLVRGVGYVRLDSTTRIAQIGDWFRRLRLGDVGRPALRGTVHILDRETFLDGEELRRALAGGVSPRRSSRPRCSASSRARTRPCSGRCGTCWWEATRSRPSTPGPCCAPTRACGSSTRTGPPRTRSSPPATRFASRSAPACPSAVRCPTPPRTCSTRTANCFRWASPENCTSAAMGWRSATTGAPT